MMDGVRILFKDLLSTLKQLPMLDKTDPLLFFHAVFLFCWILLDEKTYLPTVKKYSQWITFLACLSIIDDYCCSASDVYLYDILYDDILQHPQKWGIVSLFTNKTNGSRVLNIDDMIHHITDIILMNTCCLISRFSMTLPITESSRHGQNIQDISQKQLKMVNMGWRAWDFLILNNLIHYVETCSEFTMPNPYKLVPISQTVETQKISSDDYNNVINDIMNLSDNDILL